MKLTDTAKKIEFTASYYADPTKYPKYDNLDIINVDKVKDIPGDYDGLMGVPITVLWKLNFATEETLQQWKDEHKNSRPKREKTLFD